MAPDPSLGAVSSQTTLMASVKSIAISGLNAPSEAAEIRAGAPKLKSKLVYLTKVTCLPRLAVSPQTIFVAPVESSATRGKNEPVAPGARSIGSLKFVLFLEKMMCAWVGPGELS